MSDNNVSRKMGHSTNTCFSLENGALTIHVTDVINSKHPFSEMTVTKNGTTLQYPPVSPTSPRSKRWRRKLGEDCLKVLLLGYYDPPDYIWERRLRIPNIKCRLTRFPPGYHLYSRNEGTGPHHSDIDSRISLYGDGKVWQSPNEARLHIAWLMSNMPKGECKCIRCGRGRKQIQINKEFNERWRAYKDERIRNRYAACRSGEACKAPPSPVDVFNEALFLLP